MLSGKLPVAGITFSELQLEPLASRLAVGCMATPDGREVLLRYYTPRVLKQLAARPDMDWHPVMFSQIGIMVDAGRAWWQRLNMPLTVANNSDETVEIITLMNRSAENSGSGRCICAFKRVAHHENE